MSEELIDVLTPDGARTGVRKTKAQVHCGGDWHRAAHIWIVTPDRRVILQRRSLCKENYPGLWDVSAAGHLSAGESAIEAAVRETQEEIGLKIEPGELERVMTTGERVVLNGGTYIDNEIHDVFVVRRAVEMTSLRLDPVEVDGVRLMAIEDLRKRVAAGDPELVPHREEYEQLWAILAG
jgi:isopentenyl-diphosphate Delta-isomerase